MDIFAPFQWLADWLAYGLFMLDRGSHLAESLNFFIYDSLKIVSLLLVINFLMAAVRYYLPLEKIRSFLSSRRWYGLDYIFAALLGAVTPFCSCSSIPLFVGFIGVGIPIGVTLTFLIASPLISEIAVVMLLGMFGIHVAAVYVVAGMFVSIAAGVLLSKINVQKHISKDILNMSTHVRNLSQNVSMPPLRERLLLWWQEGLALTLKLLPYILVGVGIGALIHGFVPTEFFTKTLGSNQWWSVPLAVLCAIPLYANAAGVVPIMEVLLAKGVELGTVLALMMATIGLSLPEALVLKKVMSMKLLVAFFGIVAVGIIAIGYIVNILF